MSRLASSHEDYVFRENRGVKVEKALPTVSQNATTYGRRWKNSPPARPVHNEQDIASHFAAKSSGNKSVSYSSSDCDILSSQKHQRNAPVSLKRGGTVKFVSVSKKAVGRVDSGFMIARKPFPLCERRFSFGQASEVLSLGVLQSNTPSESELDVDVGALVVDEDTQVGRQVAHLDQSIRPAVTSRSNPSARFSMILGCGRVVPTALAE